jgi:hypothetical protein
MFDMQVFLNNEDKKLLVSFPLLNAKKEWADLRLRRSISSYQNSYYENTFKGTVNAKHIKKQSVSK